jgi:hypothetical protein
MTPNTLLPAATIPAARPVWSRVLGIRLAALVLTCWPAVPLVVLTSAGRGLVLTPLWATAFAVWVLSVLTIVLHLAIRGAWDPRAEAAVADAASHADSQRRVAADLADNARYLAMSSDANSAAVSAAEAGAGQAATLAVSAAAHRTAAVVRARRAGLKSLVVGADGRGSTSKVQAVLWTYAVLLVFLTMLFLYRTPWSGPGDPVVPSPAETFDRFVAGPLQPEYFALLGLPIAAAIAAKGLTTGKTIRGDLVKPATESHGVGAGIAEVVSNDSGQADLVDLQYFAFNVVALAYFLVQFATVTLADPGRGLPTIPPTLLSLAGVSATGYLVKKSLETGVAPTVTSVSPLRVCLGRDGAIDIVGDGFLGVGGTRTPANQILLDGRPLVGEEWRSTSVRALLPQPLGRADAEALGWRQCGPDQPAELVVRDDRGNSSPAVHVEILLPAT